MITSLVATLLFVVAIDAPPKAQCAVPTSAYAENAKMSYAAFDQQAEAQWGPRALVNHGCYAEAAQVTERYLLEAAVVSEREKRNLTFHMAQYSAFSGAAKRDVGRLVAATIWPEQPADFFLDWNTYVRGTWAYFAGEKGALSAAREKLKSSKQPGDQQNARVLAGLLNCFDKPYLASYDVSCRPRD